MIPTPTKQTSLTPQPAQPPQPIPTEYLRQIAENTRKIKNLIEIFVWLSVAGAVV